MVSGGAGWVFTDDGATLFDDAASDGLMRLGVDVVDRGAEDGDGDAAGVETASVSNSVDTESEAGNDDNAFFG